MRGGVDRKGEKTDAYQPGVELLAKYTFFAEGCRGHLGLQLEKKFSLRKGVDPQVYGIGLKELWEVQPANHKPGLVVHTAGWPLDADTYGGSFLYHFENNLVAGAKFNPSPTREELVTPGNSWTLDTSTLDARNYAYYCRIHPWMVGQVAVMPE